MVLPVWVAVKGLTVATQQIGHCHVFLSIVRNIFSVTQSVALVSAQSPLQRHRRRHMRDAPDGALMPSKERNVLRRTREINAFCRSKEKPCSVDRKKEQYHDVLRVC